MQSYGWDFSQQNDNELITRFIGENSDTEFHLIIGITQHWIALTIYPYLLPFPMEKQTDALQLLCKHNFQLKLARLGMTEKGETTLCVDLPIEELSESLFHLGLDIISYYADIMYPDFVSFWAKE